MTNEDPKIPEDDSVECAVCSFHLDAKLSLNGREALSEQEQPISSEEGIQSAPLCTQTQTVPNDVSNLSNEEACEDPLSNDASNEEASREQSSIASPPCKSAAWRTPEPIARVAEFTLEASSWPTLEEARHTNSSGAHVPLSCKETISVSSPAQKASSSQENHIEAHRHTNTNPSSKFRSSYRKGSYSKPKFPPTENIRVPPMGVHVPSANMFNVDQSRKRNGVVGMNNFSPGRAPFPHHRGEGLAPFPHNSVVPPYARGSPGWHHYGRGYCDANYNQPGFVPRYNQQFIDPRNMHQPIAPWQYQYPNFPGEMPSYMPAMFPQGQNSTAPYYGPRGPLGGIMQGSGFRTLLGMLRRQIDYYFSKENLVRDFYLTSKMDEEGFVPVSLIASFPRVKNLTSNLMHILEALKNSSIVEVKNGMLRSREWRRQSSIASTQTPGIESLKSSAPSNIGEMDHAGTVEPLASSCKNGVDHASKTGVDHAREQSTAELLTPSSKTWVNHTREQGTSESLALSNNTGVHNAGEQGSGESKEFGENDFDRVSTLTRSKSIADSCAATWTGLSANLGPTNVLVVTSIDLR